MSAYFYDEALLRKLQNWTRGTNITITGVNDTRRLFEVVADTTNDKPVQLPLVTLSRNGGYTILNKQRRPITFDGTIAGNILKKIKEEKAENFIMLKNKYDTEKEEQANPKLSRRKEIIMIREEMNKTEIQNQ